jgi:chromosomal replication initiation ATPase DnaA
MNYFIIPGMPKRKDRFTCKNVIKAAADAAGVTVPELLSRSRKRKLVRHRQVAMFICCKDVRPIPSLKEIGREFTTTDGRRFDHSTIIYSRDEIQFQLGKYEDVDTIYKNINLNLCS